MPSTTSKQQRFFQAVKQAKHNPNYGDSHLRKVADAMSDKDIDDFASNVAELKVKKAVLSVLKELHEPMYLDEEQEVNPVAKKFNIKDKFDNYIKKYLGQPLQPKELEAFDNFEEAKPVSIKRTEVVFETTDDFQYSTTTVIKKLKEGNQFVYTAFTKHTKAQPAEENPAGDMGNETPEEPSATPQANVPTLDDIVVSKSVLFQDEIKGGAILAEFLKKLDI